MIVVKIELWPMGSSDRAKEIGRMIITNDGTGTGKRGNYIARIMRRGTVDSVQKSGAIDADDYIETLTNRDVDGEVKGYPRAAYSVWALIGRAVKACGINGVGK